MPDWPTHLIVPLLALLIVSRKENQKYILMLTPLALLPDFDSFAVQHRALLHNVFIPLILGLCGSLSRKYRAVFIIASVYFASHVLLDMFAGGVVLFYPIYNRMAFVDASLLMNQTNDFLGTFDYGFRPYAPGWKTAYGYISDSTGTGAMVFVLTACVCVAYRRWREAR
ncbi:MAG: metal-dependent hydrolase [Candidatus Methanoperedens sp.]